MLEAEMKDGGVYFYKDMLHPKVPNCIFMSQYRADTGDFLANAGFVDSFLP
eukprot:CAMPEP_0170559294 /NCGR_PEP_ID=MMETSP0211-20121228/41695_1 /TAXON_ID=311385 /ORGANISM="Pseudokeronopsis sp., Strain OXSARD2" /LENGTH=50 /DNA_ID=CAMNT_0010872169 /DNA_START=287 /DNA_END=438 /DNA_ORIENTATION=+